MEHGPQRPFPPCTMYHVPRLLPSAPKCLPHALVGCQLPQASGAAVRALPLPLSLSPRPPAYPACQHTMDAHSQTAQPPVHHHRPNANRHSAEAPAPIPPSPSPAGDDDDSGKDDDVASQLMTTSSITNAAPQFM